MKALRRIGALARATARDLFAGHGGALLLLAVMAVLVATFSARGRDDRELRAVALRERTAAAAAVALFAVTVAAAHAVADDRRTRRLPQLLATPLRPLEYVLAKWAGVGLGIGLPLVAIQVALVAFPDAGLLRHPEQFAPRRVELPTAVLRTHADGRSEAWRPVGNGAGAWLAAGERMTWRFEPPPAPAGGFDFEVKLRALAKADAETRAAVAIDIDGAPTFEPREVRSFAETTLHFELPAGVRPREVVLRPVGATERVRVDLAACRLLGALESPLPSLLRVASGQALLLLFGGALAVAFALFVPDVLALLLMALVALNGFLRPLLIDVATVVADDHAHASLLARKLASVLGKALAFVPDLSALVAGDRLATAAPPFVRADWSVHVWPLALAVAALVVAGVALRARRRGIAGAGA